MTVQSELFETVQRGLSSRQERVHRLLGEVIGPGPAACYFDACRLRYEFSPYATAVHLVAHLFREIDSAVRGVIVPRRFVPSRRSGHDYADQIREALSLVGLPVDADEADVWSQLDLQELAHRRDLSTRSRDAAFERMCDRFDALFDTVLSHFAGVFEVCIRRVDQLRHLSAPGKDDVSTIRNGLPNHPAIFSHFFNDVLPEGWIQALERDGFFAEPPESAIDPLLSYAARVASSRPELSITVISSVPVTTLGGGRDYLTTLESLPVPQLAKLLPRFIQWLASLTSLSLTGEVLLTEPIARIADRLIEGGYTDAAEELLAALSGLEPVPVTESS